MSELKIDHGLIELELTPVNGGLEVDLYSSHDYERMMITLSLEEIVEVRNLMTAVLKEYKAEQ